MLWVPGQGLVNLEGTAVDRAVREYDERLFFGRNATTGLHTVFMKMEHGEPPLPILAFADGVPAPEQAVKRLYDTDARRHGLEILDRINRENEEIKNQHRYAAAEASGQVAEVMESYLHDQGQTPHRRVVLSKDPVKKTAVKRG
jgi:hypothetical protein